MPFNAGYGVYLLIDALPIFVNNILVRTKIAPMVGLAEILISGPKFLKDRQH
jgi:hypothetical protein